MLCSFILFYLFLGAGDESEAEREGGRWLSLCNDIMLFCYFILII
jgi:hypothetical protein